MEALIPSDHSLAGEILAMKQKSLKCQRTSLATLVRFNSSSPPSMGKFINAQTSCFPTRRSRNVLGNVRTVVSVSMESVCVDLTSMDNTAKIKVC